MVTDETSTVPPRFTSQGMIGIANIPENSAIATQSPAVVSLVPNLKTYHVGISWTIAPTANPAKAKRIERYKIFFPETTCNRPEIQDELLIVVTHWDRGTFEIFFSLTKRMGIVDIATSADIAKYE